MLEAGLLSSLAFQCWKPHILCESALCACNILLVFTFLFFAPQPPPELLCLPRQTTSSRVSELTNQQKMSILSPNSHVVSVNLRLNTMIKVFFVLHVNFGSTSNAIILPLENTMTWKTVIWWIPTKSTRHGHALPVLNRKGLTMSLSFLSHRSNCPAWTLLTLWTCVNSSQMMKS